ncbi:WD40 repeat domain-containing protein [Singulisphaera sp. Ch08]|uniref:WD40 repeat domain-containing protein n=1 Tax=Singulisphaera sp. Ch08 TaxID=3120278 RepID=A0AAU7CD84_9BACT
MRRLLASANFLGLPRLHPTAQRLIVAAVLAWTDMATAQEITFRLPEDDPDQNSDVIRSVAYSPDGSLLAVGYGRFTGLLQKSRPGQAVVWDTRSGKRKITVRGQSDGVCSVSFSPDGSLLAIAEYPGIIRLCGIPSGRVRLTIKAPAWTPGSIAFSPDGKWLAAGLWTGGKDGVEPPGNDVVIWDVATGNPSPTLKGHTAGVSAVAFSPDGKLLLSGGGDGVAKVWEVASGRVRATLRFPSLLKQLGENDAISVDSVAFSPDGRTFITSAGVSQTSQKPEGVGEVTIWNATNDQRVATLQGFAGMARQVVFSPAGKCLATTSNDGTIRFWDSTTFRMIGELKGWGPIAFSPDGRDLVSSNDEPTLILRRVAAAIQR